MAKRLFFLSLIILSVAMGFNWWKERAKMVRKPKIKIQKPVEFVEPENGSETVIAAGGETASETASGTGDPGEASETAGVASGTETASGTAELASGTASSPAAITNQDPVLAGWDALPRNPFEKSVYSIMLQEAGKTQADTGEVSVVSKKKTFKVLSAPWSGIFETDSSLKAQIGGNFYMVGDIYEDKTILKIGTGAITLDDASFVYLIPKKGMTANVSSDGIYIITKDDFNTLSKLRN